MQVDKHISSFFLKEIQILKKMSELCSIYPVCATHACGLHHIYVVDVFKHHFKSSICCKCFNCYFSYYFIKVYFHLYLLIHVKYNFHLYLPPKIHTKVDWTFLWGWDRTYIYSTKQQLTGFLLGLFFYSTYGGDIFLQNIDWLSTD
jgi:hypothetical protein